MLSIRLRRTGKKARPTFRVIVLDNKKDPWGNFLENLGTYNPRTKETLLNVEHIKEWLAKGAQPSKTVHNLLITQGITENKKVGVSRISKKRKEKLAEKEKEKIDKAAEAKKAESPEVQPEEPKTEAKAE